MSKPNHMPIDISENLLKGVILLSKCSHSSGIKGVLMVRRSGNAVALLGIVGGRTAECTKVFAAAAGLAFVAAGRAIPCVTVPFT